MKYFSGSVCTKSFITNHLDDALDLLFGPYQSREDDCLTSTVGQETMGDRVPGHCVPGVWEQSKESRL